MNSQKQRIEYIDFMKGICIILICSFHIDMMLGNNLFGPCSDAVRLIRVPMYYFLSGIFFKNYDGFLDFTRRKTNNILIPFFFWYLIACLMAWVMCDIIGINSPTKWQWSYLTSPLTTGFLAYNVPIWFLASLFSVNIVYYAITMCTKQLMIRYLIVFILSVIGYCIGIYLGEYSLLPFALHTTLIALPFFALGSEVKLLNLLNTTKYDQWGFIAFPAVFIIMCFIAPKINIFDLTLPSYFMLYFTPGVTILAMFWMCKNLKKVPVINYLGHYSIIILVTHTILFPQIAKVMVKFIASVPLQVIATLILLLITEALIVIPFCVKFLPHVTAQKELIKPLKK